MQSRIVVDKRPKEKRECQLYAFGVCQGLLVSCDDCDWIVSIDELKAEENTKEENK